MLVRQDGRRQHSNRRFEIDTSDSIEESVNTIIDYFKGRAFLSDTEATVKSF